MSNNTDCKIKDCFYRNCHDELLAALKGCMFSLSVYMIRFNGEENAEKSKTLLAARQAIHKAEGGKP